MGNITEKPTEDLEFVAEYERVKRISDAKTIRAKENRHVSPEYISDENDEYMEKPHDTNSIIDTLKIACSYHKGGWNYDQLFKNFGTIHSTEYKYYEERYKMYRDFDIRLGVAHTPKEKSSFDLTFGQIQSMFNSTGSVARFLCTPSMLGDHCFRHDSYWCIDFVRSIIIVIDNKLCETSTYTFYNGKKRASYDRTPNYLTNTCVDLMCLNKKDKIDSHIIKLIRYVAEWYLCEKDAVREAHEEDMKRQILDDFQTNRDQAIDIFNNVDYTVEDLADIQYGANEIRVGADIIRAVQRMIDAGTDPVKEGLTADAAWTTWGVESAGLSDDDHDENIDELERVMNEDERATARARKAHVNRSISQMNKKNAAKTITIEEIETGYTNSFASLQEAAEFLGISRNTMTAFRKGTSALNKKYRICC